LQASVKSKNIYYQGTAYRLKAMIEMYIGNLDKSSDYYFKALEKFKDTKYNPAIARAYSDVAAINYYSEKYDKAIEYWRKSLSMSSEDKDYQFIANSLSNLGIAFLEHNDFDSSEVTLKRAIIIANIIHDESIKASIYTNLTKLEYNRKNYKKAIEYSNQAALYYEATKNYSKLSNIYSNGAELARTGKDYQTALIYINKAFEAMKLTENKTNLNTLYLNKAAIQYDLKDYKPAYENLLNYIYQKDSLVNIENQKNINELEKKYQLTEQKKENALLNEQLKTQEIYSSRMQITIGLISLIVVILAVTAFLVIKQNRAKNLINAQLFEKNNIINLQKSIVEDQHRDITDSIKYAKRIQEAILPPLNLWNKILPSSFILHLPKDVLSGDFYWIEETENYTYVAAADCTGHGVPGALISIVNFNLLTKLY
jgi:Tfp pilus assembly protein PilF